MEEVNPRYYQAHELFTPLTKEAFRVMVKPFIKAYYKHEYGEELELHSDESGELYIFIHVGRDYSEIYFNYCKERYDLTFGGKLKNDKDNIKVKDILNFLYYEYLVLFVNEEQKNEKTIKNNVLL